jgi:hypothetical protein
MLTEGAPVTSDGIGVLFDGDVILAVYQGDATIHRTRWLFDRVDEAASRSPNGLLAYLVILANAAPPDAETRGENLKRLRNLGPALRCMVTTPVGDTFGVSVVRTVMRALVILDRRTSTHHITSTIDEGLSRLIEAAGPSTPAKSHLLVHLRAIYRVLGVEPPPLGRGRPG